MDPLTITSIAAGLGKLASGASDYLGKREENKIKKKQLKEQKRKTFADLLNDSLSRSYDSAKDVRRSQADISGARAKALQDLAAGYRQALVR